MYLLCQYTLFLKMMHRINEGKVHYIFKIKLIIVDISIEYFQLPFFLELNC